MRIFGTTIILAILSLLLLIDCNPETEISRDYPLVKTLSADSVTEARAVFNGRIIGTLEEIDEYGFVWSNSVILNIRDSYRIYREGAPEVPDFSISVSGEFEEFHTYYVSSYVRSGDLIIYGNTLGFSIKKSPIP